MTNRYAAYLASQASTENELSSRLAAAAAVTRGGSPRERAIAGVGASVAGPILTCYLLWIFRRAEENGLRRIYFLSRDGELLLEMADQIQARLGLDLELRYLYGSRQAWHLPSLDEGPLSQLEWVQEDGGRLTPRQFLGRLGVDVAEFADTLRDWGIRDLDAPLGLSAETLRARLDEPRLRTAIYDASQKKRQLYHGYLRQEGLLDGTPSALVDLGWRGRLMGSLARAVAELGCEPPLALYVGLIEDGPRNFAHDAWLFDPKPDSGPPQMGGIYEAFETFCAGTHGPVTGYRESDGTIGPALASLRNDGAIRWGLQTYRSGIAEFLAGMSFEGLADPWIDTRVLSWHLLSMFWEDPTREEALAWGAFPTEVDQEGHVVVPLAGRYSIRHAFAKGLMGGARIRTRTFWIGGSKAAAPPLARHAFKLGRRIKQHLRRAAKLAGARAD